MAYALENAGYTDSNIINAKFSNEPKDDDNTEYESSSCALGHDDAMPSMQNSIISWDAITNERLRLNKELPKWQADVPKLRAAMAQLEAKFNNHLMVMKRHQTEKELFDTNSGFLDPNQIARYSELQQQERDNRTVELKLRQELASIRGQLQTVTSEIEYAKVVNELQAEDMEWVRFPCSPFDYVLITSLCYAIRDRVHNRIVSNQFEREIIESQLANIQAQTSLDHCESIRLESNLSQADELYTRLAALDTSTDDLRRYSLIYRMVSNIASRELTKEELQYKVGFPPRTTAQIRASWIESRAKKAEVRLAQSRQKSATITAYSDITL